MSLLLVSRDLHPLLMPLVCFDTSSRYRPSLLVESGPLQNQIVLSQKKRGSAGAEGGGAAGEEEHAPVRAGRECRGHREEEDSEHHRLRLSWILEVNEISQ